MTYMEEEKEKEIGIGIATDNNMDSFSFTSCSTTATFNSSSFSSSSSAYCSSSSVSGRSSLSVDPRLSVSSSSSSSSSAYSAVNYSSICIPIRPHPHRSSDPQWSAIRASSAQSSDGSLHLHQIRFVKQLGSGNLARVYHCRLSDDASSPDFALKVVDTEALARAGDSEKLSHVSVEGEVLSSLDHPFLPTLYARLDSPRHTCFLIDYCPRGDLHSLLRRQPGGRFQMQVARFYAAEVLLALEYLHASGYVYRDLKPENILRRQDGHLMLSDFDLCLKAHVVPSVHKVPLKRNKKESIGSVVSSMRTMMRCGGCLGGGGGKRNIEEEEEEEEVIANMVVRDVIVEPEAAGTARSWECVGTHEYLAPEVIRREGHGNAVDWWAFGVLVYEMLFGRTPFKGPNKESTLKNIIKPRPLRFPAAAEYNSSSSTVAARDLIERLLVKDPNMRLGTTRGAADIKTHPFFHGIKWPLLRNYPAPTSASETTRRLVRTTTTHTITTANNNSKSNSGWNKRIPLLYFLNNNNNKNGKINGQQQTNGAP